MASAFGSAYALALATGKRSPHLFSVEVNNKCNLSCRSCFISEEYGYTSYGKELSPEELEEKIQEQLGTLAGHGHEIIVAFAGKEPLFDDNRFAQAYAAVQAHEKVVGVAVVTNGDVSLVRRNLDILKGVDGIDVSLNGGTEAENAVTRGEHSFERALEGIALLREYSVNVGISYLIMQGNERAVDNFSRAVEQTGVRRVSYSIARNPDGQLQFTEEKTIDLLARAIEQTPQGVKVLVESRKRSEMQLLAERLRGSYVEDDSVLSGTHYVLPKITGTSREIAAPTQETGPSHVRLLYDGRLMQGKDLFMFI